MLIIPVITIIVYATMFSTTQCTEVQEVTFKSSQDLEKKIITHEITKKCVQQVESYSISEDEINDLKSLKVELLQTKYNISVLQKEVPKLEQGVNAMLDRDEETMSTFHKEYLEERQKELSTKKWILEKSLKDYPVIRDSLEEKIQNITVTATNENELNKILEQIESINVVPIIELDQKTYTWTDKVYLTIVDLLNNKDPHKVETIGGRDDGSLKIQTRNGVAERVMLLETGYDTGIFTAEFILTGFTPFDANGDGSLNDVKGITYGYVYFDDGFLPAKPEDRLTVTYVIENQKFEASANVKWNIAEAQFLEYPSKINSENYLRIIDPDYNLDPESIDKVRVKIFSDSDPNGISIMLMESNQSTGIFEGKFEMSSSMSENNSIHVEIGDTLTASFMDYTLPKPYNFGDSLEITTSTVVQ